MTTRNELEFFSSFEISLEDFNVFAAAMLLLHNDIFKIKKSCVSKKRFSEVFHCDFNHTLLAEDGKLLKKKNTFTDFIDCGEYLIAENFTSKDNDDCSSSSSELILNKIYIYII